MILSKEYINNVEIGKPEKFNLLLDSNRKGLVPDAIYEAIHKLKKGQCRTFKSDKPNALRITIYSCIIMVKKGKRCKNRKFATRTGYEVNTNTINSVIVYRTQ